MPSFKKTIATARAKVADADTKAFMARLEGATPHDVLTLCAHALAAAAPLCCEEHADEFWTDFLQMLNGCVAEQQEEQDAAKADGDPHTSVH